MHKLVSSLSIGLLASSLTAQACLNTNIGTGIGITPDSVSVLQPIGFAFPFDGNTYTDFAVSDHGLLWLSNAGVPAPPVGGPFLYTPQSVDLNLNGPVIAPFWSDTVPGAIGDIFVNSSATECVVTWKDMIDYGGATPYTFQLTLAATGEVKFVYGPNVINNSTFGGVSDNAVIGCGPGNGAAIPASIDLSTGPVTADATTFEEFLLPLTFDMAGDGVELIPLVPGYVVLPLGGATGCASVMTYGTGCGSLALDANSPVLGQNWNLNTTSIDPISPIAITFFGTAQGPGIGLPVIGLDAPGCSVWLNTIIGDLTGINASGSATVTIAIPNNPSFQGATLTGQSVCLTTTNNANLLTSNGVEIGRAHV